MKKVKKESIRRGDALIATDKRFKDKPFNWSKASTCIHLTRYHAAKMGHKLPIVPRFSTQLGAKKALKATGFKDIPSLLDKYFERIPIAMMNPGDIIAFPGDQGWHSIMVKGDLSKFLGWHEHAPGCAIVDVSADDIRLAEGAWRL